MKEEIIQMTNQTLDEIKQTGRTRRALEEGVSATKKVLVLVLAAAVFVAGGFAATELGMPAVIQYGFWTFTGRVSIFQLIGQGSAPTAAAGSGAGVASGGTCTVTGNNLSHIITVVTGSAPAINAQICSITFNNGTLLSSNRGCSVNARNANAASQMLNVFSNTPSTTSYSISVGATALPASTTNFVWYDVCI
jgi:hypothetical protein